MAFTGEYETSEPSRSQVDALAGMALLEFGSPWCGYCRRAEPLVQEALAGHVGVRHIRIADASGRRLGRSFGVKLWPTFVLLDNGREAARVVRPGHVSELLRAFEAAKHEDQVPA
jgi:thioredoxin 1